MIREQNTKVLFRLLRIALGVESASAHSVEFEGVSWQSVYALARRQGVLAVAFDGLERLFEQNGEFAKSFPQSLKLQWINAMLNIERRYEYTRAVCAELGEKWAEQSVKTLCLKGMAFSIYYPVPSHRECGDFDCYLFDDYAKGNAIARELGARVDDEWYKHSEIIYKKVMIENHQYIVAVRNGSLVKELNVLLDDMVRSEECESLFDTCIKRPSSMFNALFMTHHALVHFLAEGVHLRHILDWTLFLQSEQQSLDWGRFYELCERFEMRSFVDCMTAVSVEVFGLQLTNPQVVAQSPYTERFLNSIIYDDMSVFSQSIGAWRTRVLLIRNLFASRWKYKAFSRQGIFSKFIALIWGYITHPEED